MAGAPTVFDAIAANDVGRVRTLINDDVRLATARNDAGISALMFAAYHHLAEMVQLLKTAILELDMFEAAALGDVERLGTLLTKPGTVGTHSADGFTALHLAAFFNQLESAERLLQAGADPNAIADNASHVQPLHSAAAARSIEMVRLLLQHGAQPNAIQHGGWTALHAAAKHGDVDMVELLLAHGADRRQPADSGETAISMAADPQILARLQAAEPT